MIDLELLRGSLSTEWVDKIESAAQRHVLPASGDAMHRLGVGLSALLDEARIRPEMLRHPAAVQAMQQEVLAMIVQTLNLSPSAQRRVGRPKRSIGMSRAIDYLRFADVSCLTVPTLCAEAQISQRNLEYGFKETFGTSPHRFLQLRRMHAARSTLIAADRESSKVSEIARATGFYELGRFAGRYKQLFGELPSQTLRRPPEEGDKPLLLPGDSASR